jgi:hypothetical protein
MRTKEKREQQVLRLKREHTRSRRKSKEAEDDYL